MKKFLNISVIAALAILPLAANAEVPASDPGATTADAPVAQHAPKYALAQSDGSDNIVATASYVKGAYNAAIKAINTVATTADGAVKGVQVNGDNLTLTNGIANVTVAESANDGKISVNGKDVAVHGLGSAAYTASTAYISSDAGAVKTANIDNKQVTEEKLAQTVQNSLDAANSALQKADIAGGTANGTIAVEGTDVAVTGLDTAAYAKATDFDAAGAAAGVKAAIEGKLDDGATGYDINANTLKVQGADVLTNASLTDYAKKTGVTNTISASSISGTVQTVATWGSTTTSTTPITASITGATYTETAPAAN